MDVGQQCSPNNSLLAFLGSQSAASHTARDGERRIPLTAAEAHSNCINPPTG